MPLRSSVAEMPRPKSTWESMREPQETERPTEPSAVSVRARRPRWVWPAVASAVLLVGLISAWAAGVFKVKTKSGVIVLENVPDQAEVSVDGEKVTVQWPKGGGPLEITVPAGKRGIEVKKDGFKTFGDEVTVEAGGNKEIRVTLLPLVPPERPQVTPEPPQATAPASSTPPARSSLRRPVQVQRPVEPTRPPDSSPSIPVVAKRPIPRNHWIVLDAADAHVNGNQSGKAENRVLTLFPPPGQGNNATWDNQSSRGRNMIIRAKVKKPAWDAGTMGITLRFNPRTWEHYSAAVGKHNRRDGYTFSIDKHFGRGTTPSWTTLRSSANRPVPGLDGDGFFELGFSAIDDSLTVTVNGKRVVQVRDSDFKEGEVMVQAWQCRVFFKDVEVKILDD